MLVEARDAVFGYGKRPVVRVDHLHLGAGRSLGIFGPNGSGKTTLVRGISGLLQPLTGSVTRKPNLRIGYLPQYRHLDLAWPMTALDAALLATSARKPFGWVGNQRTAAHNMLHRLGVLSLASSRFSTLSGGQQRRILLAGAMAADPEILLLDEPTDGLDVHSRDNLLNLLNEFKSPAPPKTREGEAPAEPRVANNPRLGGSPALPSEPRTPTTMTTTALALVMISHDVEDLLTVCDQIARLHPGKDVDQPATVEIIPPDQFARQLTALSTHATPAHREPRP